MIAPTTANLPRSFTPLTPFWPPSSAESALECSPVPASPVGLLPPAKWTAVHPERAGRRGRGRPGKGRKSVNAEHAERAEGCAEDAEAYDARTAKNTTTENAESAEECATTVVASELARGIGAAGASDARPVRRITAEDAEGKEKAGNRAALSAHYSLTNGVGRPAPRTRNPSGLGQGQPSFSSQETPPSVGSATSTSRARAHHAAFQARSS